MTNGFIPRAAAAAAIGVTCAVSGPTAVAQRADPVSLDGGDVVERGLDRGTEHRYLIALKTGEHARVIVEQRGIDVIVEIRSGDDAVVAEFEDEMRSVGEEHVDLVGDIAGSPTIVIRAAPGGALAGAYAIRVADRRPATDADRALLEARALRTAAARLDADGRFDAARLLLERALALTEAARGADDVQTAAVVAQLAAVYRRLPDNQRSEALFHRALSTMDQSIGPDHPTTAVTRSHLAQLYLNMGVRVKSEALLAQALDAIDKSMGHDNRWYVGALVTLATLRRDGVELKEDEAILRRALATLERTQTPRALSTRDC